MGIWNAHGLSKDNHCFYLLIPGDVTPTKMIERAQFHTVEYKTIYGIMQLSFQLPGSVQKSLSVPLHHNTRFTGIDEHLISSHIYSDRDCSLKQTTATYTT